MQVGVVGGCHGSGIAQVAAQAGHQVVLFDTKQEALDAAKMKLSKIMARLVEKGKLNETDAQDCKIGSTMPTI